MKKMNEHNRNKILKEVWNLMVESMNTTESTNDVREAITTIKRVMPDYWQSTLAQRLNAPGAAGSITKFKKAEDLESAILSANWEKEGPGGIPGSVIYKTNDIGGKLGIVPINEIPDDTQLRFDDRKNTGKVSVIVGASDAGNAYKDVSDSRIILGVHEGNTIPFTFHPGPAIPPSIIDAEKDMHGKIISKEEAQGAGFDMAKIVSDDQIGK